ncbi:hypothetical protein [Desulfovibrio sp. JC022]|uniref:hypothetical protein n=1 Tax=Desulfovibrio sp. JC022 TaxID=2593642 RepID=UPI0013CFA5D1|nr:hypothetical protein [Desulfovibrio sp. JC022]NDV21331.1 hypothetical protein [Desulfovibrio sp. JC022]
MKKNIVFAFLVLFVVFASMAHAKVTVFTYRTPESNSDKRYDYDNAVLKLALEKTKDTWGDYELVPSPVMNFSRSISALQEGKLENPMFKLSVSEEHCKQFKYAAFPVDLGIVGYRMFFVSERLNAELSLVDSISKLKEFSIGQGFGWLDSKILKAAGFKVVVVAQYKSLFPMVAKGRFDLFSRGVNEVEEEYKANQSLNGLRLNKKVGFYYPLPRFFFTNKRGKLAARRVYEGLVLAYNDGSLLRLWEEKYESSLKFSDFRNVNFYKIKNPFIKGVDDEYKKFFLKIKTTPVD